MMEIDGNGLFAIGIYFGVHLAFLTKKSDFLSKNTRKYFIRVHIRKSEFFISFKLHDGASSNI